MLENLKAKFYDIADKINKKYKEQGVEQEVVFLASAHPERLKPQFISTGHEEWDKPLCGGVPRGAVTTVHGSPWAGKTSFCLGVAAELLKQGKHVMYVGLEAVPLDSYSHIIGEEGSEMREYLVEMRPASTAEHLIGDIEEFLYDKVKRTTRGIFDLIIIDSLNNLITEAKEKAWLEGPDKIPQMASRAKLIDDFLSRLYGKGMMGENGTSVMIVAHDRANIAGASMPMAPKTIMSGGESLKYNSKVTLKMSRKPNSTKTGQEITMTVEKNTCTGLLGDGTISIIYRKGKDDTQTLIDKAKEFGYLISGTSKTSNILILPGLGDLEITSIKADKVLGTKAVTLANMIKQTIRENTEIAHALREALKAKKPSIGIRNGFEYKLQAPVKVIEEETNEDDE